MFYLVRAPPGAVGSATWVTGDLAGANCCRSAIVFRSGVRVVVSPLDATHDVLVDEAARKLGFQNDDGERMPEQIVDVAQGLEGIVRNASIHDIEWVSRTAKFGLFIGEPSAWNRGFGSDAIRTLVRFAFDEMNLRKLRIHVFEYNERAKHVLEAQGFVQEGRLRQEFYREGTYHDIVILSIFRGEQRNE